MKRLFACVLAVCASGLLFAQVTAGIGVRGGFGFPVGTSLSDDYAGSDTKVAAFKGFDFDIAMYGNIKFDAAPGFSIQPELQYSYNKTGIKYESADKYGNCNYSSFDIPVLLGYSIEGGNFLITPQVGPYLSIPLGKLKQSYDGKDAGDIDIDSHVLFGSIFGLEVGYKTGDSGVFNAGMRFATDFGALKTKVGDTSYSLLTRRKLTIDLGYTFYLGH